MVNVGEISAALAQCVESAYVLTTDRRIVRTNAGWRAFADANDGGAVTTLWAHGACIDEAMSPVFRDFYAAAFDRALTTGIPWEHDYECSSPSTFRKFRMVVYPVARRFLVVVNAKLVESPHVVAGSAPNGALYESHGVITACGHCRRTRRATAPLAWDWVPAYVETPPANLSHGLCEPCKAFHFGSGAER